MDGTVPYDFQPTVIYNRKEITCKEAPALEDFQTTDGSWSKEIIWYSLEENICAWVCEEHSSHYS